jgi:hypothetical protein
MPTLSYNSRPLASLLSYASHAANRDHPSKEESLHKVFALAHQTFQIWPARHHGTRKIQILVPSLQVKKNRQPGQNEQVGLGDVCFPVLGEDVRDWTTVRSSPAYRRLKIAERVMSWDPSDQHCACNSVVRDLLRTKGQK